MIAPVDLADHIQIDNLAAFAEDGRYPETIDDHTIRHGRQGLYRDRSFAGSADGKRLFEMPFVFLIHEFGNFEAFDLLTVEKADRKIICRHDFIGAVFLHTDDHARHRHGLVQIFKIQICFFHGFSRPVI